MLRRASACLRGVLSNFCAAGAVVRLHFGWGCGGTAPFTNSVKDAAPGAIMAGPRVIMGSAGDLFAPVMLIRIQLLLRIGRQG